MNSQDFTKIKHFYFCLLIAILMKQNECYSYGTLHQKKFLMQWLVKAKNKKIFTDVVDSEIEWGIRELRIKQAPVVINQIKKVYLHCMFICCDLPPVLDTTFS